MTSLADRLMESLTLQRQSFEQQVQDADQLINDSANQMCRFIENERQRLLQETAAIRHNTVVELDKVTMRQVRVCTMDLEKVCATALP